MARTLRESVISINRKVSNQNMKTKFFYLLLLLLPLICSCKSSKNIPVTDPGLSNYEVPSSLRGEGGIVAQSKSKEEFRGAWVQTVFQDRYTRMNPHQCQEYLTKLVQNLYETGFNAILFQVRSEGDAFYDSPIEPWSRFIAGSQGKGPLPAWDPMEFMIKLCHERGMEFHAWINPYRMTASKNAKLDASHVASRHPEWCITYDGRIYLDPGLPEVRAHIRQIIKDIVNRYDVDAIHMDDYFYPYPTGGLRFADQQSLEIYGPKMGFDPRDPTVLGDFRRRNVNILIKSINEDIKSLKPWVRFGISPFGIYRNKSSWSEGSKTNGLQSYDDLYADVIMWAQEGWIDYLIPQIYWEIGHKLADYETLCKWWADHVPSRCHLYIGQSIERSLDPVAKNQKQDLMKGHKHFANKIAQARSTKKIRGNCFWYAYQVDENAFQVRDFLKHSVFCGHAALPAYTELYDKDPDRVQNLNGELVTTSKGIAINLKWNAPKYTDSRQKPRYYNVYRFLKGEKVSISSMAHLYAHVAGTQLFDYNIANDGKYTYVVTAVDAYNNEGKQTKKSFKIDLD